MPKLFSKIIIALLLTVVIWGGGKVAEADPVTNISTAPATLAPVTFPTQTAPLPQVNVGPSSGPAAPAVNTPTIDTTPTNSGSNRLSETLTANEDGTNMVTGDRANVKKDTSVWDKMVTSLLNLLNIGAGIMNGSTFITVAGLISLWALVQSVWLAISAAILNEMMIISIQDFPSIVENSGVGIAWTLFRNLINIAFIFILLYIAISMIIGSIGPKAKSTIAQVIIAALLINFSLFFTKVMIDASNLLAVELYNYTGHNLTAFGDLLMNGLGIQALWSWKNVTYTGQVSTIFMLSLQLTLMISLAWAYIKMAFLLLGRMVMLLILMSLSPVAFLGGAVPGLGEKASEWWKAFVGQLMVAPAFAFILIVVSMLLDKQTEINALTTKIFRADGTLNNGVDVGPFIYYILIIAILSAGVKLVKKLSSNVGEIMDKVAKGAKNLGIAAVAIGATVATGGAAGPGVLAAAKGLITGDLGKKRGFTGMAARYSRDKFMEGTKDITQGKIDLKKIEKDYKQSRKENEERIMKELESVGPQKALDREKRLKDTKENINRQVGLQNPDIINKTTETTEKIKDLEGKIKTADEKIAAATKERDSAITNELKTLADKKVQDATKEKTGLNTELIGTKSNKSMLDAQLLSEQNKVAKAMGTSMEDIAKGLAETEKAIKKGEENKNAYIKDFQKAGVIGTGFFEKGREEMVEKMRAQQGKFNGDGDLRKAIAKIAKDSGINVAEDKEKEKPKTETK